MILRSSQRSAAIWWICLGAIAVLVLNVTRSLPQISTILLTGDGDDLMRLQQVRDWLAGQSWFDTHQYRVLPPEGISMHWSRYVDLGIAAFLVPASWVLPPVQAELAAIILWPLFLACLAVLVIGHGTNRLLGPAGAIGALVVFLTWGKLGGEFSSGRIDHHGIQILCATALFFLSVIPGSPPVRGALAGGATALSLAIGLEMLPFLALLWGMVVLRHAFGDAGTGRWLLGFCLAFGVAAPLLMAGQTPVSQWGVAHCDVLATPVLGLAAIGIVATVAQVLLAPRVPHPVARLTVSASITGLGLWLAAPLLLPCLAGPYADAAEEVRIIIKTLIIEALPASTLLRSQPDLLLQVILPPVVIALLALGTTWLIRARIDRALAVALAQAFAVVIVGLGFALVQIRAANLMTPVIPLLGGLLVHGFAIIPRTSRLRAPAALGLVLAIPAVVEGGGRTLANLALHPATMAQEGPAPALARPADPFYCRTETALAEIASLPRSVVFVSLNLGPAVLVHTPHATTSAAYHRSTAAYWNGVGAFQSPEDMREALASTAADYLLTCVGAREEHLITRMEQGPWPAWLEEVTGDRREVRVFKVDKAALARGGTAP